MREVGRTFKRVVFGRSRVDGKTYRLEGDVTRTIIRGRHIKGYQIPDSRDLCIFPYDSAGRVLSEDDLKTNFPHAYQYLMQCRPRLAERPAKDSVPWYARIARCVRSLPVQPQTCQQQDILPRGFHSHRQSGRRLPQ